MRIVEDGELTKESIDLCTRIVFKAKGLVDEWIDVFEKTTRPDKRYTSFILAFHD